MANNTYIALDKTTVAGSPASSVTLNMGSTITQTYTDLVLIVDGTWSGSGFEAITLQFNGDTGSNYSRLLLSGNGSSVSASRESTSNWGILGSTQSNSIFHIMNFSNSTTLKTVLARGNAAGYETRSVVGLWRGSTGSSTQSITSILVKMASGNFNVGTTFSLYGICAEGVSTSPKATGGAIYSDSTYYYHVFGATGTFTPLQSISADILVVAGGGGGGSGRSGSHYAGGGGAGGLRTYLSQSLSATGYTCTVGGGGTGGATQAFSTGTNGGNSSFAGLTGTTGGGGGGYANANGLSGGSGGGAGGYNSGSPTGGAGTSGEGNAGGSMGGAYQSGGGGGAGAVGSNGSTNNSGGGNGGIGATSSFITSIVNATGAGQLVSSTGYFAGGGGGAPGGTANGIGGAGGGGNASDHSTATQSGKLGTGGGGGGGAAAADAAGAGGNGGSGSVIIRYAKA